jgi:S1-C subfamily serine protease
MSFNLSDPLKEFFQNDPLFRQYKFQPPIHPKIMPIVGSASVLLTPDGYIITNNHVVKDALKST